MFTGLVEETGAVSAIADRGLLRELTISCAMVLDGIKTGDSIAVDGVCLSVERFDKAGFTATATSETLSRSTLKQAARGSVVNLERSVRLSDRLGGHLVQGHVDAVGRIVSDRREGESLFRTVGAEPALLRYVAEKGSIAVDGVSLTVAEKRADGFTVALIPDTLKRTSLLLKRAGDAVNLEADILAKYVESLLKTGNGLTEGKLREYGF